MGDVSQSDVAILQNDIKHLNNNHNKLESTVTDNHNEVKERLSGMDSKLSEVLQFMAAQEEKNETAKRERDRIFKASTLLPVAILTSVISGGVSYLMKTAPMPTNTPTQQTYIIPQRSDQKQLGDLTLVKE